MKGGRRILIEQQVDQAAITMKSYGGCTIGFGRQDSICKKRMRVYAATGLSGSLLSVTGIYEA